ncbi:unnamed protein product [Brassica oleracea var. botrytis]
MRLRDRFRQERHFSSEMALRRERTRINGISWKKKKKKLTCDYGCCGTRSLKHFNRTKLNDFQTSTKIETLREEIRLMVQRDGSASNSFQPVHIILGSDKLHPREGNIKRNTL